MRGAILEVRAAEPREAAALLREQLPPGSVGLFGDRVHVVTERRRRDGRGRRRRSWPPAGVAAGRIRAHRAVAGGRVRLGAGARKGTRSRRAEASRGRRSAAVARRHGNA